jgi:uncharacterized protein YdeI (YjbR/CyaY-like superfamily)
MDITETFYAATRAEWREWLAANFDTAPEIWLVSYLVKTERPSVPYNDAVEEALCFGWIDGIRKKLDDERHAQRFTPRRPGSPYSQTNRERLARLIEVGKVHPSVVEVVRGIRPEDFEIPEDVREALRAHDDAWAFFSSTSPSYQRIRAAYVDIARVRPGEYEKRLRHLVEMSAKGKQFESYDNPQKGVMLYMRDAILDADDRIEETIKWKSPTFMYEGNIASFNPRSKQHASLMFHTGASIPGDFPHLEGTGEVARYMKVSDMEQAMALQPELIAIVKAWCDMKDAE